jgi:hypothetical protein
MDIAQAVVQSLGRTVNFCLLYLAVVVGAVLLLVAVFKVVAWAADRRRAREWDAVISELEPEDGLSPEPCVKCGGPVRMETISTRVCARCGAREYLAGVFARKE